MYVPVTRCPHWRITAVTSCSFSHNALCTTKYKCTLMSSSWGSRSRSRASSSLPSQAVNLLCKTVKHTKVAVWPGLKLITLALSHPCNNYLHCNRTSQSATAAGAAAGAAASATTRYLQLQTNVGWGKSVAYFRATATKANITRDIYHGQHVGHLINTWQSQQQQQKNNRNRAE